MPSPPTTISEDDLTELGYEPGPVVGEMLRAAAAIEAKGISDRKYILKLLKRRFGAPPPRTSLRDAPAPLAEAIAATSDLEEKNVAAVRRQMRELLRVPVIARGSIMPDACPAGSAPAAIPVGGAIAVENAIIPSAHSSDICCSMFATLFESGRPVEMNLDDLMGATRFGPGGRSREDLVHHPVVDENVWDNPFLKDLKPYAEIHMADQGDGNHFAFLGKLAFDRALAHRLAAAGQAGLAAALQRYLDNNASDRGELEVLVTHHGSRGLGARVFKRGQQAAEKFTERNASGIPKSAAWIDATTEEGEAYWEALEYVGRWTRANHESIHRRFTESIGVSPVASFGNEHNFVWRRSGSLFLHGKGATPAWNDPAGNPLLGLIPLNMAAPILVVLGRDNSDFLSFAPHGAGRNQSRKASLRPFRTRDGQIDQDALERSITESTRGIAVRWFCGRSDLTETPIAYKQADQVKAQISEFGLADVVAEITPLGCIMAGDTPKPWEREKPLTPKQKRQIEHRADRRKTRQNMARQLDWDEDERF